MPSNHFEVERWKSIHTDSDHWYEAIELLGVGGNAATFLAHSTTPPFKGTMYAIKVFRRLSDPERREDFLKEAEFLQGCTHPAILRIYDTGVYYENPFFVCEYLPQTLGNALRQDVSFVQKVSLARELLAALVYLESLDPMAIHRDIKPANIFVKGGSCVLGDFGLMKRLDGDYELDVETLKQSPGAGMPRRYRTPDLVQYLAGEAYPTTKSDVFQLGLVVAEMFTGNNPCKPSTDIGAPVELDPIGHIPGALGAGVFGLLNKMLDMDPASRPRASELVDGWEGLFRDAVDMTINLEGRVFRSRP